MLGEVVRIKALRRISCVLTSRITVCTVARVKLTGFRYRSECMHMIRAQKLRLRISKGEEFPIAEDRMMNAHEKSYLFIEEVMPSM